MNGEWCWFCSFFPDVASGKTRSTWNVQRRNGREPWAGAFIRCADAL
jgi:hypothetical protein